MHPQNHAASNLKSLRMSADISRKQLVDAMAERGVSMHTNTLRRLEEGEQPMKVDELVAFAGFFEVDLETFVAAPINPEVAQLTASLRQCTASESALFFSVEKYLMSCKDAEELLGNVSTPGIQHSPVAQDLKKYLAMQAPLIDHLHKAQELEYDENGEG